MGERLDCALAETVVLSTCNRVEIYGVANKVNGNIAPLFKHLAAREPAVESMQQIMRSNGQLTWSMRRQGKAKVVARKNQYENSTTSSQPDTQPQYLINNQRIYENQKNLLQETPSTRSRRVRGCARPGRRRDAGTDAIGFGIHAAG